ncbi:hypothetical protein ABTJ74_19535 [Acinetobacter baumannii]
MRKHGVSVFVHVGLADWISGFVRMLVVIVVSVLVFVFHFFVEVFVVVFFGEMEPETSSH